MAKNRTSASSSSRESLLKKDKKGKLTKISPGNLTPPPPPAIHGDEGSKKSAALAFAVLSKEDSEELLGMEADEMESKLQKVFQLAPDTDLKEASVLDYYVGAVYWGKQEGFSPQQLSGFFTVIHTLLHKVKDQHVPLVDCLKDFCKMLVGIGSECGPDIESGGMEFFSVEQAKSISNYVHTSFLQHYKLYECMFNNPQTEEIIGCDLSIEVPLPSNTPFPPPLDEGISETVFNEFLTIPTPSLSSEQTEAQELQEAKPQTPVEIELPPEAADIFNKLSPEDVKSIVEEVSSELLQNIQIGVENKIRVQENAVMGKINKIHNVLQEPEVVEEPK